MKTSIKTKQDTYSNNFIKDVRANYVHLGSREKRIELKAKI